MDFEQIKNQFLQKGREALDAIKKQPKLSEQIGIPYAKEVNTFFQRGIEGGFEKGAKGFGEMFEAYKPTVIPNIQSGFTTAFKDPSIARKELLDTNLVIQNYPSVKAKDDTIKSIELQLKTGQREFGSGFNAVTRNLTDKERQSLSDTLIRIKEARDKEIEQIRKDSEQKLLQLAESQTTYKQAQKKGQEIIKKYGAEDIYTPEGALTRLGGTGPDILGQYAVPAAGLILSPNGKLKLATTGVSALYTYLSGGGSIFNEALSEGATEEQAYKTRTIAAPINTVISLLPVGTFLRGGVKQTVGKEVVENILNKNIIKEAVKVSKSLPGKITEQALAEGSEEYLQTVVENASKLTYKELKSLGQLTEGAKEAAFLGAIGGGITAAVTSPLNRGEEDFETQILNREFKIENVKEEANKYKSVEELDKAIKEKAMERNMYKSGSEKYKAADQEVSILRAAKVLKQREVIGGNEIELQKALTRITDIIVKNSNGKWTKEDLLNVINTYTTEEQINVEKQKLLNEQSDIKNKILEDLKNEKKPDGKKYSIYELIVGDLLKKRLKKDKRNIEIEKEYSLLNGAVDYIREKNRYTQVTNQITPTETPVTPTENNLVVEPEPTPIPSEITPEPEIKNVDDVVNKIEEDKIKKENEVGEVPTSTPDNEVDIDQEVNNIERLLAENKPNEALDYLKNLSLEKGEKVYKFFERVAEGRTDLNPNFVTEIKRELLKYEERKLSAEVKKLIELDNTLLDEITKQNLVNQTEDLLKIASEVQELVDTNQLDSQLFSQEIYNRVFDYMRRTQPNEANVNLFVERLYNKLNYNGQIQAAEELSKTIRGPIRTASGQSVLLFKYFLSAEKVIQEVSDVMMKGVSTLFGGRREAQTRDLNKKIEVLSTEIANKLGFLRNQFGLDDAAINEIYNKVKDLSVDEVNRIYKVTGDSEIDNLRQNIDVVEDLAKSKEVDKQLDETFNPETNKNVDVLTGLGITGKDKNKFTGKSNQKKRGMFQDIDDEDGEVKEPFEILANKFDRDIDLFLNGKPAKYRDVVKQMIAQLYKVGKEKLPQNYLQTPEGRIKSLYENLREALKNVDEYAEVWNEAKVIIYDKYGKDPKVEAILIDFFNRDIPNVFSDSDAKRVYKDILKENNIKFKDLVKNTLQDINATKVTLRQSLLENLDLDIKTAQTLVNEVYKLFNADVKKAINTPGYLVKLRPSTPELILNKVDKDIEELLKGKPEQVIESYKRQVRRLARVAKEKLPFDKKLEREKSNNEFFKDLGIALKDYKDYRYNWARFRQMLSEKYKNNQEILDLTKDIIETYSLDVFTPSEFNRVFNIVKKDLNIFFKDLVKKTNQEILSKRNESALYLIEKLGVSRIEADTLLQKFFEEFDNQIIIARNKGQGIRIEPSTSEKIADKLFAYSENSRANPETKQVADDVITQYLRIAKGFFQNIGDTTKLTPEQKYKLLRDTIRKISTEQKKYYQLHQDALKIVREKYKNDPVALEQLEEYFNGVIPGTFTKQQIKQTFKFLTSDIDFVQLVKSHFSKRTETIKDLETKIMNEFGLSQKDATKISNEVYAKFNEKYNNTIRNEVNKRLRGIEKYAKGKQLKDINQKFVEYVNLGFFDSEGLSNVAKDVFNIPVLTPEIRQLIQTEIWKMQSGEQTITDAYINISKEMIRKDPFSWKNIFKKAKDFNLVRRQIFYSNILSGIQTFFRNAYGFIYEVPMRGVQITTEAAINSLRRKLGFSQEEFGYEFRDIPTYYVELFRSMKQAANNAMSVWDQNYIPRSASQYSEKDFGLEKIYEVLYGKQTWVGLRAVANGLEMVDQFGMTIVTAAESAILQDKGMNKEDADKQANETAKRLFLREDILEGNPEEVKAQIGAIDSWINKFTKWILSKKRTDSVVGQAILDLVFPIVTVGSNLLKLKLERNLIAQGYKIRSKIKYGGDVSTRDMASLVIAAFLFIQAWDAFSKGQIQGEMPEDEEERKKAEEAGRKRNSVDLFGLGYYIPLQYLGSNSSAFEFFAALQDTKDSKKYLDRTNVENFIVATVNVFLKIANETALRGLIDINKGLTVDNLTEKTFQNMATNAFLNSFGLYRSFFRDLAEISDEYKRKYEGPLETAMAGIPGVRKQLEPKYDYYGDPVKETFDSTVLPYPIGVKNEVADQEYLRLLTQAQLEVQARNLPEVKQRKEEKDIAKGQLRKILEQGINEPGNYQKAQQIILQNGLSSEDVSAEQNKVLQNKLNAQLPQNLKGYTALTNDQLNTVAKTSPEMAANIEQYKEIERRVKAELKSQTLSADKGLRSLTAKRTGKIKRLSRPKLKKLKLKKPKKSKSTGIKKIKLAKIKTPKLKIK